MRLSRQETEAVEYLREWAREGFPRRVDGSFPSDFLVAMRRLMGVPVEKISPRSFEMALCAGPDFDYLLHRGRAWTLQDTKDAKERLK